MSTNYHGCPKPMVMEHNNVVGEDIFQTQSNPTVQKEVLMES